jgi:hypothetical protein
LAGRSGLFIKVLCALFFSYIAGALLVQFTLPKEVQIQIGRGVTLLCGAALLLGTAWLLAAARRRAMIGWPTVYVAVTVWTALALPAVLQAMRYPVGLSVYIFLVGVAALAVAPLAAAPLALAWNRTR